MHGEGLQFLWLELTNRCNLRCGHCYTDSHPGSGHRDRLTTEDLESVLRQAYALGCRSVQFIGGEPPSCTGTFAGCSVPRATSASP